MIEIGDIVCVNKDDACMTLVVRAEVLNVPRGEGDAWGFRDLDNPREVWTTERITITKRTHP